LVGGGGGERVEVAELGIERRDDFRAQVNKQFIFFLELIIFYDGICGI
jgi:hypothetical protein